MKKLILAAMAASIFLAAQPAISLEPWHDYYRQKAHLDKKARKAKQAQEAAMKGRNLEKSRPPRKKGSDSADNRSPTILPHPDAGT